MIKVFLNNIFRQKRMINMISLYCNKECSNIRLSAEGSNAYTSKGGIFVLGVAIATLLRQSNIAGLNCDLWYYFAGRSYLHSAKTRS